jgi:chromosome segregation ATPase
MSSSRDHQYWKESYDAKCREFAELKLTFHKFQQSSQEYETELEEELRTSQAEEERAKSRLLKAETIVRKLRDECERVRRQSNMELSAMGEKLSSKGFNADAEKRLVEEMSARERRSAQQIQDLTIEIEEANERIGSMQADIDEMEAENAETQSILKSKLRDAEAELLIAATSAGNSSGRLTDDNQQRYIDLINSHKEEIRQLQEQVDLLNEEKDQLEARVLEETELNEELTGEVSDLTDDFMMNSDKIEMLEDKLKQAEAKLAEVEARPPVIVEQRVEETVSASPAANDAEDALKEEVEELAQRLERAMDDNKKITERLQMQTDLNQELSHEVSTLTEKNIEAQKRITVLDNMQHDASDRQRELQLAQQKSAKLEEELFNAQAELNDMANKAEMLQRQVDDTDNMLKEQAQGGRANMQAVVHERDRLQEQYDQLSRNAEDTESKLNDMTVKYNEIRADFDREIHNQQKRETERKQRLESSNERLQAALQSSGNRNATSTRVLHHFGQVRDSLSGMSNDVRSATEDIRTMFRDVNHSLAKVVRVMSSTQENFKKQADERKKLFDSLQDMKGNIRVFCRVRPLLSKEVEAGVEEVVELPGNNQISLVRHGSDDQKQSSTYTFDRVYGQYASQSEVYGDVEKLVMSTLDGYNVCIFAYGQTGSGKTYTMEGPSGQRGISFRAMASVFREAKSRMPQYTFKVNVSLLEIYNEQLHDLLRDEADEKSGDDSNDGKLAIRRGAAGMYVSNLSSLSVNSPEEVMHIVSQGNKNRAVGATNANEHSSRSHSILMVTIEGTDQVTQNKTHGKLYLVDLAGSERVGQMESSGQRFVEGTFINKSLSALGDVMMALSASKKPSHVPYRNSKLTHLLQDSLGGNSKTMMFVNVSPVDRSAPETVCSLQFARRVRRVKLNASAAVENATLNKYKSKLDDVSEERKTLEERLKKTKSKFTAQLRDKEEQVYELHEKLKMNTARMNQMEIAKRKEMAELHAQQARFEKLASASENKRSEQVLQRKLQALEQKHDHVQKLLRLSQRENKALKEASSKKSTTSAARSPDADRKARVLEKEVDQLARRERVEKLARKHLEEAKSDLEMKMKKQIEDKDQVIRVLRDQTRKLKNQVQSMKTKRKKERLDQMYDSRSRDRSHRPTTSSSSTSGSGRLSDHKQRINDKLQQHASAKARRKRMSQFGSTASKLRAPQQWDWHVDLVNIKDIIGVRSAPGTRSHSRVGRSRTPALHKSPSFMQATAASRGHRGDRS